jgi:hypothetical protein
LADLATHGSQLVQVTVLAPPGRAAEQARQILAEELARSPGERVAVRLRV